MSNDSKCPQCGAVLKEGAPAGLCPNCLMALNLKTETILSGDVTEAQPPLPPEQIAPYFPQLEILECLGRGGMGVVYKARQKSLNRLVALKLLAPERVNDPAFAERFTREAQALAALNHPNIVTVHDFGQAGGFYFLLMEFVDGVNLRHLLRATKFTPEQALAIIPPLCDALQFAHERGIVHRDIKPENLLLDKSGRIKIADFGIAKMLRNGNETSTASTGTSGFTQTAMGTQGYSAPEQQASPERVDSRADIYSLGVVFYEMLTGELPGSKFEPPSRKVRIDVRLDDVVLRALEKTPELRWQTAADLRTQVETIALKEAGGRKEQEVRSKEQNGRDFPAVAVAIATTYLGTVVYSVLCELWTGHVLGEWILALLGSLGGSMLALAFGLKLYAGRQTRETIRRISAFNALLAALPVVGLAVFFLQGASLADFKLDMQLDELIVVLFTWAGALLLPFSYWRLSRGMARGLGMAFIGILLGGSLLLSAYLFNRKKEAAREMEHQTQLRMEAAAAEFQRSQQALISAKVAPSTGLTLSDVTTGTNCFVDLERGALLTPPPEILKLFATDDWPDRLEEGKGVIALDQWMRSTGADILCCRSKRGLCLFGGFTLVSSSATGEPESGDDYWLMTDARLIELVDDIERSVGRKVVLPHVTDFSMRLLENETHKSFAFKTRDQAVGVLEIAGFNVSPPGITIRFKIANRAVH